MVNAYYPESLAEALSVKKEKQNDAVLVMGGSDVMVIHKTAENIIYLSSLAELKTVEEDGDFLSIGAGCTYAELIEDERVPKVLRDTMREIASPAIRNVGTVAGNVCNASPAGDTLPVLYAMDAVVVVSSAGENGEVIERRIPIEDFILGIRKIDLHPDEIVTRIEIPQASYKGMTKLSHTKVGARKAEAIAKLSFAGICKVQDDKILDIRIAFGSVGITVLRRKDIEEKIVGLSVSELSDKKSEIISEYDAVLHPISDQRSSEIYRRKVCLNLLDEFLG
ncbi:CO or xanthine dehydrogenase, FAD-binding subunit [Lachnospiraceae bacterium]|nr:CO or xanthine dehydrogenase, FAD-binding subunit [Lachnospiraceae bacterium]